MHNDIIEGVGKLPTSCYKERNMEIVEVNQLLNKADETLANFRGSL